MASTSPGVIKALYTSLIYSGFFPDGVWVAARHAWVLVLQLGGERGRSFVFFNASIITEADCFE